MHLFDQNLTNLYLILNEAGLFKDLRAVFSQGGASIYSYSLPFLLQEELIKHQYNFIKLLNDLFKVD